MSGPLWPGTAEMIRQRGSFCDPSVLKMEVDALSTEPVPPLSRPECAVRATYSLPTREV